MDKKSKIRKYLAPVAKVGIACALGYVLFTRVNYTQPIKTQAESVQYGKQVLKDNESELRSAIGDTIDNAIRRQNGYVGERYNNIRDLWNNYSHKMDYEEFKKTIQDAFIQKYGSDLERGVLIFEEKTVYPLLEKTGPIGEKIKKAEEAQTRFWKDLLGVD